MSRHPSYDHQRGWTHNAGVGIVENICAKLVTRGLRGLKMLWRIQCQSRKGQRAPRRTLPDNAPLAGWPCLRVSSRSTSFRREVVRSTPLVVNGEVQGRLPCTAHRLRVMVGCSKGTSRKDNGIRGSVRRRGNAGEVLAGNKKDGASIAGWYSLNTRD